MATPYRVVFFCLGNICRSPTAHAVFRQRLQRAGLADRVRVDSAGTHAQRGEAPDVRSQRHALARGYDLADLRARQLVAADFDGADLLLAMDRDNLAWALARCPPAQRHKLRRLSEFARACPSPVVPDPYAGGPAGFETVLDLVEDACDGLLAHVRAVLAAAPSPAGGVAR